jgi:hypothetical protein
MRLDKLSERAPHAGPLLTDEDHAALPRFTCPQALARALSIREHTARYLLDGRLLPGARTAQGIARARGMSLAAFLWTPSSRN